ncbi:YegS/Rv2252/BmrU family lipid kinase [Actinomyces sp. 2119]|nr:YegS/Rv2252/BmrU family lipid kinase [Actinomyces sp. 2119]
MSGPGPSISPTRGRLESVLAIGFALAFLAWTRLLHSAALTGLDQALHPPDIGSRSAVGQVAEALALVTHPVAVLIGTTVLGLVSYKNRMRRLSLALGVAALGIPLQQVIAWRLDRPAPASFFADSISALGGAYPAGHVTATTLGAWVLVTLARAHRRGSSRVLVGTVVGYTVVCLAAAGQWVMGLATASDVVGGFLLGATVANTALWAGGIDSIVAAWARRGLPRGSTGKRAALIYNPTKFDDLSLLRRRVEADVLNAGWLPTLWLETSPDDPGREMTRRALDAGVDLVMVAGGDGTVRAVSAELAEAAAPPPMALIPAGTGNLLARNLAVPLDTDQALQLALHGQPRPIDVVHCRHDGGAQRFVVMAGVGLDARIMGDVDEHLKRVIRSGAYALAAVHNAFPAPFTATVTLDDGEPTQQQAVMALVGNVGTITGGIALFPDAQPDDGYVDLLLANPDRVTDWARLGAQSLTGQYTGQNVKGFTFAQARRITIETVEPVAFELDGDTTEPTRTLRATVEPGALRVVAPARSAPTR